ncbi:MAG: hypothetical protein OEV62_03275 [Actinomycetota bacterium]|nr:hypothetical protein [Actinomycetota bacterium]
MTDRQALAQLLASKWWQGYKIVAPFDARKVELEYQGRRRPTPSSTYAQALVHLCRNHPPANPAPPPPPPPSSTAPFDRLLFLRNPRGGIEDIAAMQAAGYHRIAVNTGDHTTAEWAVVTYEAYRRSVLVMPWARCRTPNDVRRLRGAAATFGANNLIVNIEAEAVTTLPPFLIHQELVGWTGDVGLSTEAWLQNGAGWEVLAERGCCVMPQFFPVESQAAKDPAGCLEHARSFGFTRVAPTYQAFGGLRPADFNTSIPHSWYCADDMNGNYDRWPA